jgi:hypothetical protein
VAARGIPDRSHRCHENGNRLPDPIPTGYKHPVPNTQFPHSPVENTAGNQRINHTCFPKLGSLALSYISYDDYGHIEPAYTGERRFRNGPTYRLFQGNAQSYYNPFQNNEVYPEDRQRGFTNSPTPPTLSRSNAPSSSRPSLELSSHLLSA